MQCPKERELVSPLYTFLEGILGSRDMTINTPVRVDQPNVVDLQGAAVTNLESRLISHQVVEGREVR